MPTPSSWIPQSPSLRLPFVKSSLSGYSLLTWRLSRTHKLSFYSTRDLLHQYMAQELRLCLFSLGLRPSSSSEVYYHPKKGAHIQTTCWAQCLARANSPNMPRNCLEEAWANCPGKNHSRHLSNNLTVETMKLVPGPVCWHQIISSTSKACNCSKKGCFAHEEYFSLRVSQSTSQLLHTKSAFRDPEASGSQTIYNLLCPWNNSN